MRHIILILFSITLSACGGAEGGQAAGNPESPSVPAPVLKTVTIKRNAGLECFSLDNGVWCRGSHFRFPSVTASYGQIVSARVSSFEVWDDTLCFEAEVLTTPIDRDADPATYCMGEASFAGIYSIYPVLYGLGFVGHESSDVTSPETFISGADMSLVSFMGALIVTDGSSTVTTETLSCLTQGGILSCPAFSVIYE